MEQDIINILSNQDKVALSAIDINDELGLTLVEDYKKLESILQKMTSQGILYYSEKKKRYLLLKNSHLLKGKLLINPKGFGFVVIGEGRKDIYIHEKNLNTARHEDIVLIELIGDKTEGRIVKIIERNEEKIIGTVYFKNNKCYVHPDKKGNIDIEIIKECTKGLVEGHKVVVQPLNESKYIGSVIHVIGHIILHMDINTYLHYIIHYFLVFVKKIEDFQRFFFAHAASSSPLCSSIQLRIYSTFSMPRSAIQLEQTTIPSISPARMRRRYRSV